MNNFVLGLSPNGHNYKNLSPKDGVLLVQSLWKVFLPLALC